MRGSSPWSRGHVVASIGEGVGQVLLVHVGGLVVVRVAIADADAVGAHPADRRVAQVHGHGQRAVLEDVGHGRPVGQAGPVRLGRRGQVGRRLGERVLRLGQADPVERLGRGDRHLEAARVGVADVLGGAMIRRRAMKRGSSPAATIVASQ